MRKIQKRRSARLAAGSLIAGGLAASGCAPRLIQDYAVRKSEVVFVVDQGTSYTLGDCQRAPSGKLTACRTDEVEFQ